MIGTLSWQIPVEVCQHLIDESLEIYFIDCHFNKIDSGKIHCQQKFTRLLLTSKGASNTVLLLLQPSWG